MLASACRPPKKQQEQKRDAGTENRIPGKKTGQEATKRHPGTKKREPRFAVREHDPKLQISRVNREPFATHSGNQVAPPAEDGVTFKFNKYLGGFETYTLPKTNIAPTNEWLEYYFPLGEAYFQGRAVSFREGK